MAKMTKSQVKKRLSEAATKIATCFIEGDTHLTNAELSKMLKMRHDLFNIVKKL